MYSNLPNNRLSVTHALGHFWYCYYAFTGQVLFNFFLLLSLQIYYRLQEGGVLHCVDEVCLNSILGALMDIPIMSIIKPAPCLQRCFKKDRKSLGI